MDPIIIGENLTARPYAFFRDGERLTRTEWFASDEEAIQWFRTNWPAEFAKGAEMREYRG